MRFQRVTGGRIVLYSEKTWLTNIKIFEKVEQLDADPVFEDEHCTSDIDIEMDTLEDDYMAIQVPDSCLNIVKQQLREVSYNNLLSFSQTRVIGCLTEIWQHAVGMVEVRGRHNGTHKD